MLYDISENNIYFELDEDIINIEEEGSMLEILNINLNDIEEIRIDYNIIEILTDYTNYSIEFIEPSIAKKIYKEIIELIK